MLCHNSIMKPNQALLCLSLLSLSAPPLTAQGAKKAKTTASSIRPAASVRPDTTKARPLGHWPTNRDLARLQSVEGKPVHQVLQVLGHPSVVRVRADGTQVWNYP